MSANFYELLKYAATGIASPDMTAFDKARALAAFGGGKTQTLTGQPPISFKANGKPLISWSMKGNGSQTGTPTPDAPIQPEFVGVRTGNLLNLNRTYSASFTTDTTKWMNGAATVSNVGSVYAETEILGDVIKVTSKTPGYGASFLIEASPNTTYTVSFETDKTSSGSWGGISDRDINGTVISNSAIQGKSATFTTHSDCAFLNVCFRFPPADGTVTFSKIMLNLGSTALPYEPFGWAEKITCAGQTVPVYLGQTQTVRKIRKLVMTGEEASWTQQSASSGAIRFRLTVSDAVQADTAHATSFCTHLTLGAEGSTLGTDLVYTIALGYLYFRFDEYQTLSDFKAYLTTQYTNGTPVTVWYAMNTPTTGIINEPLCKIGDYADELHSTDAGVTIPTAKGQNVLTVDTELQPSEMTITYKK